MLKLSSRIACLAIFLLLAACAPVAPVPASVATATLPRPATEEPLCTAASALPEPDATEASAVSLFPSISDKDWVEGSKEAKVTFLEYGDFQ